MTPPQDPWITRMTAARRTAGVLNHRGVLQRRTLRVYARRRGNAVEEVTAALEKRNDQGMCPGHLVSKGGLEPPRDFSHQPLKLARLPISPLRRG